ncbi:centromere protein C isoform X2 [Dendrobates tinctorius]|uniref:centromere protein C isoform X2 n=1 Tax=Dendrobates tinctorius TaxID=92724 RepID=UPI003CC9FA99
MADYRSFKKQSYRPRYRGNRFQDVPDVKPGDNAVSFVTKYFNLTNSASTSDIDSTVNRTSSPVQVTSHQSREEEVQVASTSRINDPPGQLKDVRLKAGNDPLKHTSRSEIIENPEFSDEDSDYGQHDAIAMLIEENFIENNGLLGNSKKCVEKLYSSNTSALQEPPSPTSKIHAKKCLSFREVAAVARKSDNTDMALRRLSHSVEQEALNLNNENPKHTDTTFDVRPETTFVMEEERGFSLSGRVSPFKKKTVLSSSTPVEAKRTPIFQEKTNLIKSTSIPQKKSENKKSSAERPETTFVMEEERGFSLSGRVSPFKKKTVLSSSTPVEAKRTRTPIFQEKTNLIKSTSIPQKMSENKKSAERPETTFVMEEERGFSLSGRVSPFKKKTVLSSSTPVEAKRTRTPIFQEKTNLIKSPSILQMSENKKSTADSTENPERMSKDPNSRRISFLDAFLKSSAFGYVGNRSPVVSEPPPISLNAITDEEFNLEGMSSKNKSFHLTLPVKAKPTQNGYVNKGEKTTLPMTTNSKSEGKKFSERKETMSSKRAITESVQEVAPSRTGEGVEPDPETKYVETPQLLKQIEKPMASSQGAHLPHIVEEEEDGYQDDVLLVENPDGNDSQNAEKTRSPILKKQTRHSLRRMGNKRIVSVIEDLDTNFHLRSRKGKNKVKSTIPAKKIKKSKLSGKKLDHQVKEKKTEKNVVIKKHLYSQSQNGRLKIDNCDKQTAETEEDLLPRKRKAKINLISTPCHAEHHNEESVFKSGPVVRQRALRSTAAIKPVACDLDPLESEDQEKHVSFEVYNDAAIFSSEKYKELFARCSIVFDPETRSDVLVDCISQGEESAFFGGDGYTSWNSFKNRLFNTGKLIIAPKKFTTVRVSMSVMIFYIEQGQVRLNLHKSERNLKAGDFFFVPPANRSKITNLQDKKAVLIFTKLNVVS